MLSRILLLLSLLPFALAGGVHAQTAPSEIKIGVLYASTGPFSDTSMPEYDALKMWVDQMNAAGGAFVKPFNKKIPIKLISYDDQSSTALAATLYNQLITQDKVDLLVSDNGSVLTSVAVPIAKEHKMFLFDVAGTGGTFFTKDNPYIALMALPVSTIWPKYLADFLNSTGVAVGIKTVAILYATNDFTGTQANALRGFIKDAGKLKIVYDQGVPTSTSNYTVLLNNIAAAKPDAVAELGFVGNDIAFFRNLQDSGYRFRFVFSLFPSQEQDEMTKDVGVGGLTDVFSYVASSAYNYVPNFGPTLAQFHTMWEKAHPSGSGVEFGATTIYGYMTGLVIERALATTASLDQMAIHNAVFGLSGKLKTLDGSFALNDMGAQVGEITPIGQLQPNGKGGLKLVVVYPPDLMNGKPIFGK